ncbi:spore germination protein [Cohnella silvisoli]|uniref:Spore germination protein n=1 Tax=Cohnella silvisoli TaxID=2873699 RepID=A0ABV1KYC6_9BACL|nr:spore germination protein [Cohnella silvisoli]MCD9021792.1 spore germination protein [Cohnella silvisoli]
MNLHNTFRKAFYFDHRNPENNQERDQPPHLSLAELDQSRLIELFKDSSDVNIHSYFTVSEEGLPNPLLVYCDGMIDPKQLNDFLYMQLRKLLTIPPSADSSPLTVTPLDNQNIYRIEEPHAVENMIQQVLSGNLVLYFEELRCIYVIQMASPPQRAPSESNTEISIKGPRDGFTEAIDTNVALIRKRLKTTTLGIEKFQLGRRSKTQIALLYMTDITNKDILHEVRERIQKIDVDGVLSSQQLEDGLSDSSYSMFPLLEYMGRPDYIADSLLQGRFAIVVDGSPMVLIGPSNLMSLIKSPEDIHLPFYYVVLERLLRMLGLIVAIFFPGFWVSISAFNLDQIPFPLLATVVISRLGLPLSGPVDLFLMIGLFELFREAGMRLPKAVGQTVAVVGGLIVGEAAISAGITGPTTLVVSAITAVSTFTLVNQSLSGSVTVIRFFVLSLSCLFGMLGFFLAMFMVVIYMSSLTSFGIPFLSPLSPIRYRDLLFSVFAFPWKLDKKRPKIYAPQDTNRQEENS